MGRREYRVAKNAMGQEIARRDTKTRREYHRLLGMSVRLRVISNLGLIGGQCILLFVSRDVGLVILICSSLLAVPFFWKERMIDVLVLMAFMLGINIIGLIFR